MVLDVAVVSTVSSARVHEHDYCAMDKANTDELKGWNHE